MTVTAQAISDTYTHITCDLSEAADRGDKTEIAAIGHTLADLLSDAASLPSPNLYALMLEYSRAAYEFAIRPEAFEKAPEPVKPLILPDGTYTIVDVEGGYFTFRVRSLKTGKLAGRTIVEYLSGPDNTLDFQAFGFVNDHSINVWSRFERGSLVDRARQIEATARDTHAALEAAGIAYAVRSSRCRRCNKVLTVPASIHRGFGPDCAARIGG